MAVAKKKVEIKTNNASMKRIRGLYSNIEHFFVYNLEIDPARWKASRTRLFNKLGIIGISELDEPTMYDVLYALANSSSKYKATAKSILDNNFSDFNRNEVESNRYELEVDEEVIILCEKYNISVESFTDRIDIIKRAVSSSGRGLYEIIQEKKSIIKFPEDLRALDAVLEYFE